MKDFGKRLKEERERHELTQAEFAKICGVGKTAQYMYEKGTRHPSITYLQEARSYGCDVLYILTGEKCDSGVISSKAEFDLLIRIGLILGLKDEIGVAFLLHKYVDFTEENEMKKFSGENDINLLPWNDLIKEWLQTCTNLENCIDLDLFSQILIDLENYIETASIDLPTEKKVKALVMLYRVFKTNGKVENSLIEETVNLAVS